MTYNYYVSKKWKQQREEAKKNGICATCRKYKADNGYLQCVPCKNKGKIKKKKDYKKNKIKVWKYQRG